jgi:hypothetical protein
MMFIIIILIHNDNSKIKKTIEKKIKSSFTSYPIVAHTVKSNQNRRKDDTIQYNTIQHTTKTQDPILT